MVCLDTSFIVALIRREPAAEIKLEKYIAEDVKITTTPITVCELFEEAYHSRKKNVEVEKVREILGRVQMLRFSLSACEKYGKLINELKLMGTPIGDLDALVASLALAYNEPLVTKDKKHFEKVPSLIVETW